MAKDLMLIGCGAGDPKWLTVAAVEAIGSIDVLFVVTKSEDLDDLVQARRELVEQHRDRPLRIVELPDSPRPWRTAPDYPAAVRRWRAQRLEQWRAAVVAELHDDQSGGFLVWGDPSLYESTLAIAKELVAAVVDPIELTVIPGISAVHALTARHRIPLNRQGKAVQIMPARLLAEGLPSNVDDAVVMLDAKQAFASIDPTGIDIYWGAYLGTESEILISGDLAAVREQILAVRADAVRRRGWMFDTYLLRRRGK